jgi:hypothetical protein
MQRALHGVESRHSTSGGRLCLKDVKTYPTGQSSLRKYDWTEPLAGQVFCNFHGEMNLVGAAGSLVAGSPPTDHDITRVDRGGRD